MNLLTFVSVYLLFIEPLIYSYLFTGTSKWSDGLRQLLCKIKSKMELLCVELVLENVLTRVSARDEIF